MRSRYATQSPFAICTTEQMIPSAIISESGSARTSTSSTGTNLIKDMHICIGRGDSDASGCQNMTECYRPSDWAGLGE